MTRQTTNQGTVDLAAQERWEDALLATGLYPCKGRGYEAIKGHWFSVAAMS